MLASTAREEDRLELTRLVLTLISREEQTIPIGLRDHFDLVLRQAKRLVHNPGALDPGIDPESIALALSMKSKAELAEEFEPLDSWNRIPPHVARKLLDEMENASVY